MAVIGAFSKQPREILPVDISYADVIGDKKAASVVATVEAPTGMTLVSQVSSGDIVQIYISGGSSGQSYRWTLLTDITIGGKVTRVEDEFHVAVQETTSDTRDLAGDKFEADAAAAIAGSAAPVIPKRPGDARSYVIDCRPLLRRNELLVGVAAVVADPALTVGPGAVVNGQFLAVDIAGGAVPDTQPHKDHTLRATVTTSTGSVQVNVTVRVFA